MPGRAGALLPVQDILQVRGDVRILLVGFGVPGLKHAGVHLNSLPLD